MDSRSEASPVLSASNLLASSARRLSRIFAERVVPHRLARPALASPRRHQHISFLIIVSGLTFIDSAALSQTDWPPWIQRRLTSASAVELSVGNDGSLGTDLGVDPLWPRGIGLAKNPLPWTFAFGCIKSHRPIVSSSYSWAPDTPGRPLPPFFNQYVPGLIGDPQARPDTVFNGPGWKYAADGPYIAYASTDYDSRGVDISGNNYPDWPIRIVDGRPVFVRDVMERPRFEPYYASDEDMFCVVKDTDTRADPEYAGPDANPLVSSIPIGLEVHVYLHSWGVPPLDDALVVRFDIRNSSDTPLDSCYFGIGQHIIFDVDGSFTTIDTINVEYNGEPPGRGMLVQYSSSMTTRGASSPFVPHVGISCLASPIIDGGSVSGISVSRAGLEDWHIDSMRSDYLRHQEMTRLPGIDPPYKWPYGLGTIAKPTHFTGTGPFRLEPGDSTTVAFSIFFARGRDELICLNDIVHRVYQAGLKPPSPPFGPQVTVRPLDGGVHLTWDEAAERSTDPVIPDSLGRPFLGYRLHRSRSATGPFTPIKEWRLGRDSLVHEYEDRGQDGADPSIPPGAGLMNNIEYYYRLTSFDEGIPSLGVPESESEAVTLQAIPETAPSSPYSLDEVQVVPNPYIVEHAGQRSIEEPEIYFTSLPEQCTISIYTVGLDLVSRLEHIGGSSEAWDLKTQGGQRVASQLFVALIQTPQGTSITRKFSVVLAE